MNIEDILAEWERKKKENLEKREEEVRQHVLQQTGAMFTEFEQAVRDGLLEKLEKEKAVDADTVTDEVEELEEIADVNDEHGQGYNAAYFLEEAALVGSNTTSAVQSILNRNAAFNNKLG